MTAAENLEERFIERLRARDERAFNELVLAYQERVFGLVLRMLGQRSEAEDMAQEVFVQVFKAIDQFRGDAKLSTWIYRIAVNLCKNRNVYLARRQSRKQDEFELAEHDIVQARSVQSSVDLEPPDQLVQGQELERIVHAAIARMDAEFREVLVLRDVEDLSYEEIMDITGLAIGTVKSRIHRARLQLKEEISRVTGENIE
ncbi:MAG TPA: sigma-70 family RNA polymerase sigma factor [Polyangiaceae bacterium]|nr:sigma-70 family RNA polymerase sigma factor [Polyangiaceae bacterium]